MPSLNTILATAPNTTSGYILKATGTSIGNSLIQDDGSTTTITGASETLRLTTTGASNYFAFRNSSNVQIGDIGYDGRDTDGLSIWNNNASGSLVFGAGAARRMTILSTGVVCIGSGSLANTWSLSNPAVLLGDTGLLYAGGGQMALTNNATHNGTNWVYRTNNYAAILTTDSGSFNFQAAVSGTAGNTISWNTRMLITNGGNVLVGTTTENASVSKLQVQADAGAQAISVIGRASDGISQYMFMNAANNAIYAFMQGTSTGGGRLTMVANSSGGVYLASGATSWTANTSDERKKKNFETTEGLAEVLQIEPVKYHFEWDDDSVPKRMGFKAQNILPLIPEMVMPNGEKMEDGSDVLTITPDYILPVLVKAIQELNQKVTQQQEQINQLINK